MPIQWIRRFHPFFLCFLLTSCGSVVDALFGESVDVDTSDSSPPIIQISVARAYVRSLPGNFIVTNVDRDAWVYNPFAVAAIAEDPEGVQFVELIDINVEPTCSRTVGRSPGPVHTENMVATTIVEPGRRNEIPISSTVATTRMIATRTLSLRSGWCPATHPQLVSAVARVRARAGNFGGNITESAIASLTMTAGNLAGPTAVRGCSKPDECPREGRCVPC